MKFMPLRLLRLYAIFACLLLASVSMAQEVVVEEFTPGTTISSAGVNNNFGKLANKANDNATQLVAAEAGIAALTGTSTDKQVVWLGYTAVPFDAETDYTYVTNGITLSMHCKSEFGVDAFVATDVGIQNLVMMGNDFAPPEDRAYFIFVGAYNAWSFSNSRGSSSRENYFYGGNTVSPGPQLINSKSSFETVPNDQRVLPVACIALR